MRQFDHRRLWRLDQDVFERAACALANGLQEYEPMDRIVAIARGGCSLGAELSNLTGVALSEVRARSNRSDELWSEMRPAVEVDPVATLNIEPAMRLLVVDDICGSGQTLIAVKEAFSRFGISNLITATLCLNAGNTAKPDIWVWTVRDWVIFPWEELPPDQATEPLTLPDRLRSDI